MPRYRDSEKGPPFAEFKLSIQRALLFIEGEYPVDLLSLGYLST